MSTGSRCYWIVFHFTFLARIHFPFEGTYNAFGLRKAGHFYAKSYKKILSYIYIFFSIVFTFKYLPTCITDIYKCRGSKREITFHDRLRPSSVVSNIFNFFTHAHNTYDYIYLYIWASCTCYKYTGSIYSALFVDRIVEHVYPNGYSKGFSDATRKRVTVKFIKTVKKRLRHHNFYT